VLRGLCKKKKTFVWEGVIPMGQRVTTENAAVTPIK